MSSLLWQPPWRLSVGDLENSQDTFLPHFYVSFGFICAEMLEVKGITFSTAVSNVTQCRPAWTGRPLAWDVALICRILLFFVTVLFTCADDKNLVTLNLTIGYFWHLGLAFTCSIFNFLNTFKYFLRKLNLESQAMILCFFCHFFSSFAMLSPRILPLLHHEDVIPFPLQALLYSHCITSLLNGCALVADTPQQMLEIKR